VSGHAEDTRNRPKKLWNASEWVHTQLEPGEEKNPSYELQVEPDEWGGETAIPGNVHNPKEHPRYDQDEWINKGNAPEPNGPPWYPGSDQEVRRPIEGEPSTLMVVEGTGDDRVHPDTHRNERAIEMNMLHRDMGPGGHQGEEVELGSVEVNSGGLKVIEHAEYNGVHTMSDGNARAIETDVLHPEKDPGGPEGEQDELGSVGSDWERQNNGEVDGYNGNGDQRNGTASSAHYDSKRVRTRLLARIKASQHQWYKHMTANIPRPSTAPTHDHRPPTDHPNPPHRQGQLKPQSRKVSWIRARKTAHHIIWVYRSHIRHIGCTI